VSVRLRSGETLSATAATHAQQRGEFALDESVLSRWAVSNDEKTRRLPELSRNPVWVAGTFEISNTQSGGVPCNVCIVILS
jgi:hypothetical protein